MALATPVTNNFHIGEAEVRIGPMTSANKLTQANSVGLLQSATVNFAQESVDLEAGLPRTLVDTAIVRTTVTVTGQAYEYSRANIRVMINEGIQATPPTTYSGLVVVAATTAATNIDTDILFADVTVGDMVVIYAPASQEKMSIVLVTAVAVINTNKARLTIDVAKTPLLFNIAVNDVVFKANQIGLGNSTATNYFALQVVGLDHSTGRPVGFVFWKASIGGGMEYAFTSENFAVTPITFKVLKPSTSEYAVGEDLEHLDGIIPTHPYGMFVRG